jgi:uncharacterized C2H2 Zn-finger protein
MSEMTGSVNCPECAMEFDSRDELTRHSRQIHTIESSAARSGSEFEEYSLGQKKKEEAKLQSLSKASRVLFAPETTPV